MIEKLFTEGVIGPLKIRNRSIRSAAYEGMAPGHLVSDELIDYHRAVAAGGIGMTTVAYASVMQSGLSFPNQLWLRKEAVPGLRKLTDAVHAEGAHASIQIGHCGNMACYRLAGGLPWAPSGGINLYGPTFPRTMHRKDISEVVDHFKLAVGLARESGFDAIEVHAGHGYLISQFLSPYSNHRKDNYGGSFENRTRFMREVMDQVMPAAGDDLAVLVKMNMRDGFKGGMEIEECLEVAKILEKTGVHAIILSGGFVSRAPMYVMRGAMPFRVMSSGVKNPVTRMLMRWFGDVLCKPEPFEEAYFLEDACRFRDALKLPLVYVGGLNSREAIEKTLGKGFDFVAFARALVNDPAFIRKLETGESACTECNTSNFCVASIYTGSMRCHQNVHHLPEKWKKELEKGRPGRSSCSS